PPSTTATLFPYTTLFRSVNDNIIEVEVGEINNEIQDITREIDVTKVQVGNKVDLDNIVANLSDTNPFNIPNVSAVNEGLYQTLRDRKSTRLNSSHVKISY